MIYIRVNTISATPSRTGIICSSRLQIYFAKLFSSPCGSFSTALSVVLSAIIGIVCGVVAATKQYSIFDNLATAVSLVGVSMPSFWLALMLCLLFAVQLGWLPVSGSYSWEYWVLPVVTLGTSGAANIMRMTRSSMLEVIRMDYIRTARAKGQSERKVMEYCFVAATTPQTMPMMAESTTLSAASSAVFGKRISSSFTMGFPVNQEIPKSKRVTIWAGRC